LVAVRFGLNPVFAPVILLAGKIILKVTYNVLIAMLLYCTIQRKKWWLGFFWNWTSCFVFRLNDVVTPLWRMPYQQQLEVCLLEMQHNFSVVF